MALYRHQWLHTNAINTNYTYTSPRGEMRVFAGSSFYTDMTFHGVLPAFPDAGSYDRNRLYQYVDDIYTNGPFINSKDSYWGGKDAGRLSQLVWIADQVGHIAARDTFLTHIKDALEDWFDADDEGSRLLYYDSTWDVLIPFPTGYGVNTEINDHDFHHGYWLMAAATVANFDNTWAQSSNWGGMIELMIRDAACWDRNNSLFPFLRCMDAYAGHSWASGHSGFAAGNNQESSSEAMNFNTGIILWGSATGNTEIRDLGIFLYVNQAAAINQYWFDVDNAVFPTGFDYETVGILWDNGGAYATWWSPEPEEIHGINYLPFTGGSLYLGHNPSYVIRNYNSIVRQNGGEEDFWQDIIWNYQAFADPAVAINKFENRSFTPEDGESLAHIYHWLYNLESLGNVETGITSDFPTYAVFNNNNILTYVAYNPGPSDRTVYFSNGATLTALAGKISTGDGTGNTTPTPITTQNPQADIGDVNEDGTVNIIDALLVAQYYVGLNPEGFAVENADTDCSGSVNIVDALLIAQFYVGLLTGFC